MPTVFVNYRVLEQPGYATLLHRELAQTFGQDRVFLASRSLRAGDDFVQEVFAHLRRSQVLLAVIGPHWLDHTGDPGEDWVLREITEAFELGIRVVPVLVEDAVLPADLPPGVEALHRCQYVRLRHYSIDSDISALVTHLRGIAGDRPSPSVFRLGDRPCRIGIHAGSIRRVHDCDVWVNSENTDMRMARHTDFSVSAIIRYWGSLRDESGRITADLVADELEALAAPRRPVAPGTALVTGSGALESTNNVRHVVHVAAVQGEPGAGYRQVSDIGGCVTTALARVEPLGVRTILFPLLGTGVAGADVAHTARMVVQAAAYHVERHPETPLRRISFLAYDDHERFALEDAVRMLPLVPES
ncbi:hypothetical protein BBK82_00605 [Lentzea guizhouensis]|uniref:Uncharacterized protein n=1 Tax=Lentzea guizhouensis TaxID=1586287 RepID=A0A1B2HAP8_9PSEU|nr:TIR domain-containing protein [Lentzea guizhouensis]ANZ34797.1 hypothetical protein BBK82_00605 [Lentzea guizhouensis]